MQVDFLEIIQFQARLWKNLLTRGQENAENLAMIR